MVRTRSLSPLVVVLLAACGGRPADAAKGGAATVTARDCETWVDHTFAVAKGELDAAMRACPDDVKQQMRTEFDAQAKDARTKAVDNCKRREGESYDASQADCYLRAATVEDMHACRFAIASAEEDREGKADESRKAFEQLRAMCERVSKERGESKP